MADITMSMPTEITLSAYWKTSTFICLASLKVKTQILAAMIAYLLSDDITIFAEGEDLYA
ncbi:MAG: hypothetical protein COV46_05200 [Deltaproteobacteria bacterium CG11_big_fil_rev_8_21_14_0_20_49_13]|nr:MAG: hypothetical protein COV46_05200 [Deltaproteobacteria bacterium CG11_big_fil_rev_8_21_14_0_20_49_13]